MRRKYYTDAQETLHRCVGNISQMRRKHYTDAQEISHTCTGNITQVHRKYYTGAQEILHRVRVSIMCIRNFTQMCSHTSALWPWAAAVGRGAAVGRAADRRSLGTSAFHLFKYSRRINLRMCSCAASTPTQEFMLSSTKCLTAAGVGADSWL
jgi:hypothetical protein